MSKNLAKCNFKNEIFITSYLIIAKKHAKISKTLKNKDKNTNKYLEKMFLKTQKWFYECQIMHWQI